jgi:hypothetical protein
MVSSWAIELAIDQSVGRPHRPATAIDLRDHRELDLSAVAKVGMPVGVAEPFAVEIRLAASSQGSQSGANRSELHRLRT